MITAQELAFTAGVALSLAGFYLPRFGPWYQALAGQEKAQLMGAFILLAGIVSYVLAYVCVGPICTPRPDDLPNYAFQALMTIVSALIANQSTFTLVKSWNGK